MLTTEEKNIFTYNLFLNLDTNVKDYYFQKS